MKTLQSCILGSLHWNSSKASAREAICVAFPAKPGQLPQERRTAKLGLIWPEARRGSLRGIYPHHRTPPANQRSVCGWKRQSNGASEGRRLWRHEGCGVCDAADASIAFVWTSANADTRLPQVFRAEAQTHFVAKSAALRFRLWRKLCALPCSSVPNEIRFAGFSFGKTKR